MVHNIQYTYKKRLLHQKIIYELLLNTVNLQCIAEDFTELLTSFLRAQEEVDYLYGTKGIVPETPLLLIARPYLYNLEINLRQEKIEISLLSKLVGSVSLEYFKSFTASIYEVLNTEFAHGLIDLRTCNPIFLNHMLGVDLPRLINVQYAEEKILDLRAFSEKKPEGVLITEHPLYEEMLKGSCDENHILNNNHLLETNRERMQQIVKSITQNGYPFNNQYIIVYNDEKILRDGQHRLACLYHMYGNIKVKICRLYFSGNYYSFKRYRNGVLCSYQ